MANIHNATISKLVISLALLASTSSAQEATTKLDRFETADNVAPTIEAAPPQDWKTVGSDLSSSEVLDAMIASGWDPRVAEQTLDKANAFDLFRTTYGPGRIGLLIVPKDGSDGALELDPRESVYTAALMSNVSMDDFKKALIESLEATVAAVCSMQAMPSQITAKASAFGLIEVEVSWTSEEVCAP